MQDGHTNTAGSSDTNHKNAERVMQRESVDSSNIKSVGYDSEASILEVEFKRGAIYQYAGVPSSVYEELMSAKSAGKYFAAHIAKTYNYHKM